MDARYAATESVLAAAVTHTHGLVHRMLPSMLSLLGDMDSDLLAGRSQVLGGCWVTCTGWHSNLGFLWAVPSLHCQQLIRVGIRFLVQR